MTDRFSLRSVLVSFFILGSGSLITLGYENPMWFLYTLMGIAGATTIGSQILLYAYVAQYYPTSIRSTGLGGASGIGRNGAIATVAIALVGRRFCEKSVHSEVETVLAPTN